MAAEIVRSMSKDSSKPTSRHIFINRLFISAFMTGLMSLLIYIWLHANASMPVNSTAQRNILDVTYIPDVPNDTKNRTQVGTENATLFMLVRNRELDEALASMRELEDRFNKRFRYPWTFLNDEPFTEEFKTMTTGMASGKTQYGLVPKEHWSIPDHIDQDLMKIRIKEMTDQNVIYGNSLSYRHMCRFNSGFFFRHSLMLQYDWYWRVEPGVHYFCDQLYDPFAFMRNNNKLYGFVISIYEYRNTIMNFWETAKEFLVNYPEYLAPNNALAFITDRRQLRPDDHIVDTQNDDYNLCHFWTNFEIANLNFFRSEAYLNYFEHLDRSGGFFYERWGDAPVHSVGVTAFMNKTQIHHFFDIGYMHLPYFRCPHDDGSYVSGRCLCPTNKGDDVELKPFSCTPKWWHHAGKQFLYNMTMVGHGIDVTA